MTPTALTTIGGGINRLRVKAKADPNSLYDLLNGYVTQAGTIKVRQGSYRAANIGAYAGLGDTKGLMAYQGQLHTFASSIVTLPPNMALHILNYPANQNVSQNLTFTDGTFAATTQIGSGVGYGLVSGLPGFASKAIINPQPGADVGSVSPTTFLGVNVNGFFQASASSTNDPNEVYLVTSPALPASATLTYQGPSGLVTDIAGSVITTNLALPAGYFAYALGTGAPAYDPNIGSVSLLAHFDSYPFVDSSPNNLATTAVGTGTTASTATKEFGAASAHFNGSGGVSWPISSGSVLDVFTSGDFTMEFWMNAPAQSSGEGTLMWITGQSGNFWEVLYNTSNNSIVTLMDGGSTANSAANSVSSNVWHAIAIVVHSNSMQIYVDGVASGSAISVAALRAAPNPGTFALGWFSGDSVPYTGYIDELRITKGFARYTSNYTPATAPFPTALTLTYNNSAAFLLKEIHFAAPYLGGIYVVAEFNVTDPTLLAEFGSVFHYWIQSSTGGSNSNEWQANTDYVVGDVVIPDSPNGLTYIASRHLPPNPVWTPNTIETIGNIVEPTVANGFKFTATATLGATPTTGETEPTWPTSDGATVLENSSLADDQTFTIAVAADAVTTPSVPARYAGLYSP